MLAQPVLSRSRLPFATLGHTGQDGVGRLTAGRSVPITEIRQF